jgi:glucosamine kinase
LPQLGTRTPEIIHFYGAGCSNPNTALLVKEAFQVFNSSKIYIEHDLLGAARALWGDKAGIVGILGTGSNACLYDGNIITHQATSLGFILGDEGSGAYLGKHLLKAYLERKLPTELMHSFEQQFPEVTLQTVLNKVYKENYPNRFLASFAPFCTQHKQNPWMYQFLLGAFKQYFESFILTIDGYPNYSISLLGSIAFYFNDLLRKIAQEYGLHLHLVAENAIAGLSLYHQSTHNT